MKFAPIFCLILILSGSLGFAGTSNQAVENESLAHLESRVNQVLEIIQDKDLISDPVRQEQVLYEKSFEIFDFDIFSRLALGRKYREFSAAQRKTFTTYFSKLISNTYFPKLAGQDVSNIKILYLDVHALKPGRDMLRTDISTDLVQADTQVAIVYRMLQKKGQEWKIYDIKIEGVSMAANYREQFKEQVSQTPDEIIAQLREKVEK